MIIPFTASESYTPHLLACVKLECMLPIDMLAYNRERKGKRETKLGLFGQFAYYMGNLL